MVTAAQQLDKRFGELSSDAKFTKPARGWIRAIREALGMTTGQLAKRLGVSQPRVVELERGEASGNITVQSLERAADALGCRLVYILVPTGPLTETLRARASLLASSQLAAVDQTMRLEAQEVTDQASRNEAHQKLVEELLKRPARLWDDP
jgi:predicted DNA-binding mobile mystery protein A